MNRKRLMLLLSLMLVLAVCQGYANTLSPSRELLHKGLDASALFKKGAEALERNENPDSALLYFSAAIYKYEPEDIPAKEVPPCVASYTNLGYIYLYHFNEYEKAYESLTAALRLSERYDYHKYDSPNLINLSQLYFLYWEFYEQRHYWDLSMKCCHEAFLKAREFRDYKFMTVSFLSLAHSVLDDYFPPYIIKDINIFGKEKIPADTPLYSYANLLYKAILSLRAGDITSAEASLAKAYDMDASYMEIREKLLAGLHLADLRMKRDPKGASALLVELEKICADRTYVDVSIEVYRRLADNFYKQGDSVAGDRYRFMYQSNRDSLLTKSDMNSISLINLKERIEQIKDDMQQERRNNKVMTGVYFMIIGGLIIAIVVVLKILRNKRKLEAKNMILYRQMQEKLEQTGNPPKPVRPDTEENMKGNKYRYSSLCNDGRKQDILLKINNFIENDLSVYSENFLIADLASAIGERVQHVSQVINEIYGKNFKSYLNELRVHKACLMLEDDENKKYTIEAIANCLGFKSRTNFMMNFKKVTGLTPSEYRKIHDKTRDEA